MTAYFKPIRLYCLMSSLIFSVASLFLYSISNLLTFQLISFKQALLYALISVLAIYVTIRIIMPLQLKSIRNKPMLSHKLAAYKMHLMIKIALANLGAFVVLVLVLLSGHHYLILLIVSFMLLVLNEWPTQNKVFQALMLTEDEQELVKSPDFKVKG